MRLVQRTSVHLANGAREVKPKDGLARALKAWYVHTSGEGSAELLRASVEPQHHVLKMFTFGPEMS